MKWLFSGTMTASLAMMAPQAGVQATAQMAQGVAARSTPDAAVRTHEDLVALYQQARKDVDFTVRDHVPDVSEQAMAARQQAAQRAMARIGAIDDAAWPIPQRADLMLALAEMRGVDFEHRVLRPWARDPSWWSTLDLGWGPKVKTAFSPPKLPIKDPAAKAAFAQQLRATPTILANARRTLTDARGDLIQLGIMHHDIETRVYGRLARDVAKHHPELLGLARAAEKASREFAAWLRAEKSRLPQHAGIGIADFDWYLKNVMLMPWTFAEMKVLGEREWERSMAFLAIEEHEHQALPMPRPVTSLDGFEALRREADEDLLRFLKARKIMTVPDWLTVPPPEGPYVMPANQDPAVPGPFAEPIDRNFFREAEDRDPRSLRAHNLPGHIFDSASRTRDPRPIRGDERLGFIDSGRLEGWAFYLEEMLLQAGWLDDRPKAREIHYVLQANRGARLKAELLAQANEWTFDQALESLSGRTPRWMEKTDDTAIYDMALYLRQPGLGLNYYFGKVQLEQLLAEERLAKGDDFDLTKFHDRFIQSGLIPIALIRWEMTGKDDQVRTMR
ncbi:DUF885 family protein [Sphingomonas sp.]|jgi:uncharacterized protein (DUF885 family)|uniref:DUF885 family protein n=1 Tax=Sphingomonas sp. TaxID=28214 RepID=UPI0026296440|nr:DUF885 family protein [Sphingomonas sp.]MDF2494616.1 hypothetical protein [Sphingomonas sp.]